MSSFALNTVTNGLFPDAYHTQTSLISGGLFSILKAQPGKFDSTPALIAGQNRAVSAGLGTIVDAAGRNAIIASTGVAISTPGGLEVSAYDALVEAQGLLLNKLFNPDGALSEEFASNVTTYTGSDIRVIVDMVNADTTSQQKVGTKQLVECTTFTISIHREKAAVRAAGYINPKGFARGRRTIAGTLVLTQFTVDVLYKFLLSQQLLGHDVSKDTQYVKVDQLPPFNMTLLFTDEYGNVSYRRVLGVDFVTDGVVYSSNDMMAEQTISYMASDFTPLLNIRDSAQHVPDERSIAQKAEQTVFNLLTGRNAFAHPSTNIFSKV